MLDFAGYLAKWRYSDKAKHRYLHNSMPLEKAYETYINCSTSYIQRRGGACRRRRGLDQRWATGFLWAD